MTILPEFHDQLYAAAQRQARRRLPQPGIALPSRLGTFVGTGLSTAVAILVAAVLLNAHAPLAAPGSKPPSVASSRAELFRHSAALRTPRRPRPTAKATVQFHGDPGYRQVDHPLVRTMALPSGGYADAAPNDVPADDSAPPRDRQTGHLHGERPARRRARPMAPPPGDSLRQASPSSVAALRAHGVNLFTYVHHQNTGVVIVPDGVTKVRLSEFRVTSHVHVDPNLIPAAPPRSTTTSPSSISSLRRSSPTAALPATAPAACTAPALTSI